MKANILLKTKCYTIGAMEYEDGADWRELVENTLSPRNITVFNPYKKPFLNNCDETPDVRQRMRESMMNGHYEKVTQWARDIRRYDLNLVDIILLLQILTRVLLVGEPLKNFQPQ